MPTYISLDEPLSHLDLRYRSYIGAEIKRLHKFNNWTMLLITHDQAEALEIADREGVEGVTFRRLASDLDVTAMALYGHVQDKSDLLSAMGDAVLAEITVSPGLERDWAERLRAYLRAVYAAFDKHRAAGVLIARPLVSPAAMRITETLLATLQDGGFTARCSGEIGAADGNVGDLVGTKFDLTMADVSW